MIIMYVWIATKFIGIGEITLGDWKQASNRTSKNYHIPLWRSDRRDAKEAETLKENKENLKSGTQREKDVRIEINLRTQKTICCLYASDLSRNNHEIKESLIWFLKIKLSQSEINLSKYKVKQITAWEDERNTIFSVPNQRKIEK